MAGDNRASSYCLKHSLEIELELAYANTMDMKQIIKSLNVNQTKVVDGISAMFIKMFADLIDCHVVNIINKSICDNNYFENNKTANVRPIYKREDRAETKN